MMTEIRQSENVVLFLDELHTLIGAGAAEGAIDASNMLKPALSRGEIQTIGATTLDEYRKYIEKDGALERRFQPVIVKAPSVPEAIEIIRGLRHKYEAHHRVKITDVAIRAAVNLADRYITDRQLPDKAIDVIDEASSRTRLMALPAPPELKEIEKELERVIREKDMYLEAQEFEKAASLREKEKVLRHRDEELKREWEKNKGKGTQSVDEEDIEFIVSRWTGIPLDKIEKAHPDVFNMMLQVLDDGRLTDSLGHVVDFKNTILIMTSNLGTSLIGKRVSPGFLQETDESTYEKMKERVLEEMKRAFRPEFLNRIDDIIVFHALSIDHIKEIIRLMIDRINKQLTEKGIELVLTPAAEAALVEKGYDQTYGARQLRRTIQKHIEDPLAEAIVRGQVAESARIEVDIEGANFTFREAQAADAPLELAEH